MLKRIVSGVTRLFGRKPTISDRPTFTEFAAAVHDTPLQPHQEHWLDLLEKAMNEDKPLVVDTPPRRYGKPRDEAFYDRIIAEIEKIQARGITSQNGISNELNRLGITSRQGGRFYPKTVSQILAYRGLKTGAPQVGGRKAKSSPSSKVGAATATLPGKIKGMNSDIVIASDPFPGNRDKPGVVGKKTYGQRADLIIIDDPVNMPAPTKDQYDTLMGMLSDRTRRRADIVRKNKQAGGKMLTADEITQIERKLAAGDVITYPAGLDSKGVNHFDERAA